MLATFRLAGESGVAPGRVRVDAGYFCLLDGGMDVESGGAVSHAE